MLYLNINTTRNNLHLNPNRLCLSINIKAIRNENQKHLILYVLTIACSILLSIATALVPDAL